MLSRVAAAVKAPRTHNRRCVTGSSGRRREGRESEPQMPNMSRHLFYSAVLLLVLVMCCGSGTVTAQGEVQESRVPTFEWKGITEGVTLESLGAPGLLKVGSDVFAVAEARCKKNGESNSFTGIASQIITIDNADKPMEVLNGAEDKTHVLQEDGSEDPKKKVDVSRPTTVVEGSDIYMLVGKYSRRDATDQEDRGAEDCGLLLVKGEVSDESSKKRIKWSDANTIPRASVGELDSWTGLIGGGGSGVKMHDDTLVFPVEGTKENKEGEKAVSLLIYALKDNAASWKLSKEAPDGGCSDISIVEWKDKKLMMMTACDDGRRRVYESGDMGESWTEALGTLSRVWGNKKGAEEKAVRSGFITAKIDGDDNRNVMLVTLPVYSEEDGKKETGKGKLHLWLTDNTHIVDIGPVSDDDAAASSLLYKSAGSGDNKEEEELIALYEKKNVDGESSHSLWSVRLTAQLQRVKDVLAAWKKADDLVSKLCPSASAAKDASSEDACSPTVKITDGLVGFLSGNFSENTWRDEYLGVNATVKGNDEGETKATKTSDGVKFTGAWAEWPVGSQGENQLYHFANYNFTLVATVSIDKLPKEGSSISVMGVKINDDEKTVLFGLSYNGGGKWKQLCGSENPKELSSTSETTHHVVILLRNGNQGSAYVDGQRVGGNVPCELKSEKDKKFSHFYIGGDGNSAKGVSEVQDVSVTVRNVLLYNRPLDDNEITALNKKLSIPKAKETKTVKEVTQPVVSKQDTPEAETPSSHVGQQQNEQGSLRTSENEGSGGLSTSAVSSVTSSPAAKESKDQSASGTFPEGHSNVDVDSSSEEVQTVDAETGDTVQGNGILQPSAGTPAAADTNAPTAEIMAHDGTAMAPEVGGRSGANGETVGETDGQGELHARDGEVNAAALSSFGNVSQGNNTDAGTVFGSGLLPSLLLLLLGLWVFAAL
ncbi:putative trans-sialidase, Group VI [Trypanosoma cruzi]|nr:putative trans-sialidase, Group VI [Trypanosoma cruzi]